MNKTVAWLIVSLVAWTAPVSAQSSSLYRDAVARREAAMTKDKTGSKTSTANVDRLEPLNPQLEKVSLFAIKTKPPNQFNVHDLISVIVREQKQYKSDTKLETEKEYKFESKLDEFFRTLNGHLAAASFTDGKPNIGFQLNSEWESEGRAQRKDTLTFRLTVEVMDIKPNGLLVLASGPDTQILVDREVQKIAFTGVCRSKDVTPDNTILSTQVFNQVIALEHTGALRDATKRGWLVRLFEWLSPI